MEQFHHYRFLLDGPIPPGFSRIHSIKTLQFSFKILLASVDLIMTKPGYGTIVEAVALQQPVLYVRRYNFVDEQPLVDYLHRYGRGVELSFDDFTNVRWEPALNKALSMLTPSTPPPPATGAMQAASILMPYLHRRGA